MLGMSAVIFVLAGTDISIFSPLITPKTSEDKEAFFNFEKEKDNIEFVEEALEVDSFLHPLSITNAKINKKDLRIYFFIIDFI
jgi:hypothetical protein